MRNAYRVADAYSTFINMFQALDALWDECQDETLAGFLSEASPFTFGGMGSADPAIWAEFSAAFTCRFPEGSASLEDAHQMVVGYLEGISNEYSKVYPGNKRLAEAFQEIAPVDRWIKVFELQNVE